MLKSHEIDDYAVTRTISGTLRIAKEEVLPDESMVLGLFKRHSAGPNSPKAQLVRLALCEAGEIIEPAAAWVRKDWRDSELHLTSLLPPEIRSKIEGVIGVVCTIGGRLERRSRQYFEGRSYTSGYLLDQVGDFSVSILSQRVADILARDRDVCRWAPGDSPVERTMNSQRTLFDWIPAHEIGVRLSSNHLMIPTKSLSFLLFVGKELCTVPCLITCCQCVWQGGCRKSRGG
jgi:hypothetical protein